MRDFIMVHFSASNSSFVNHEDDITSPELSTESQISIPKNEMLTPSGVLRDRYTQHDNAISHCHSDDQREEESRTKYNVRPAEMLTPSGVLRDRCTQYDNASSHCHSDNQREEESQLK